MAARGMYNFMKDIARNAQNLMTTVQTEGVKKSLWRMHLFNTVKPGVLRGTDAMGNRYYEDDDAESMTGQSVRKRRDAALADVMRRSRLM